MENHTDQELVALTLGDRNIFAVLIARYEVPIRRYIIRISWSDAETTKDILQETFIKAYINLNDFDSAFSFSAWLYRIAHNETITHFRKQKNRPQPITNEEDLVLFERIADDLDIEMESDMKFQQVAIESALQEIEQHYRDVLILRFFKEKSYDEISDILQLPSGTVATYLNRGKAKLKEVLKKYKVNDV